MKKLTKIIAGTVLVGGIGVGTYTYVENTPSAFAAKNVISEKQAKDIALEKTKGGTVTEMELDREGLKDKYEIEVLNGEKEFDLDIVAETGKISKVEEGMKDQDDNDNDDDGDDDNNSDDDNESSDRDDQIDPAKIKITSEQAQSIALKKVSGTIKEMSLDDDYVYEFEIQKDGKDIDVNVDAITGEAVVDENDNN
ncbi:PepSY domain-containing protein [Bacillus sp. E(2018)]|uniref:PepSY domain-containing protein n=1 Tax=Bacillus sp. E(2018) TaxID=2502239 RepID=UPI0010F9FCD6|nr:PepSY domain-containing protein [Bacillus sp. E(2018)]